MISLSVKSCKQRIGILHRALSANICEYQAENVINSKGVNRSTLLPQHRNILFDIAPYNEPYSWIHLTEKYKMKIFGRYGLSTGVNPYICFKIRGTSKDLPGTNEKHILHDMLLRQRTNKFKENEAITSREVEVAAKLDKLEQWKQEMRNKIVKKEAEALAVKQQKQRLIEEVRRHFGFNVDHRDERFKEMLEQKEREEKRKQKEAKRKAKEVKIMERIVGNNNSTS